MCLGLTFSASGLGSPGLLFSEILSHIVQSSYRIYVFNGESWILMASVKSGVCFQ